MLDEKYRKLLTTDAQSLGLNWQMHISDQLAMLWLLEKHRPHTSIEVGCGQGGSLQAISKFSERVFSLDLDKSLPETIGNKLSNVEFIIGNSAETLPQLIHKVNTENILVEFVLIDGDHSEDGVKRDINAVLKMKIQQRTLLLMHDSFHPFCRQGILNADWRQCSNCHCLELDLVPGIFFTEKVGTAEQNSMWGGLAFAVLEPFPRTGDLHLSASYQFVFDQLLPLSSHFSKTS